MEKSIQKLKEKAIRLCKTPMAFGVRFASCIQDPRGMIVVNTADLPQLVATGMLWRVALIKRHERQVRRSQPSPL